MQYFCINKDEKVLIIAVRGDFWGDRPSERGMEGERERKKKRGRKILRKLWYSVGDPNYYIINTSSITHHASPKRRTKKHDLVYDLHELKIYVL